MTTPALATQFASHARLVSRRSLIFSFAAAAPAVLMLTSARAQGDVWREYRPADLPFRIEFPGAPEVETKENEYKDDYWIKSVDAQLDYAEVLLGVYWMQYRHDRSIELETRAWRKGMEMVGTPVTREEPLVMSGFPAREFISQSDNAANSIARKVVMAKETILVSAVGDASIHRSADVRRFFDSFRLLRSAP
jgi:hypothetical protein